MRHSSLIFKRYNHLMVRALTLLWKYAASQPQSIERVGMDSLRGFVDHLRRINLPDPTWGELDIEEMFPCLDRAHIPLAIQFFRDHACQQSPKQELVFRIHKGGIRSLDTIGCKKSDPAYYQFSFHDVSNLLSFELLANDYFTLYNKKKHHNIMGLWLLGVHGQVVAHIGKDIGVVVPLNVLIVAICGGLLSGTVSRSPAYCKSFRRGVVVTYVTVVLVFDYPLLFYGGGFIHIGCRV